MTLSHTPSILSLVWSSSHGLSPFYAESPFMFDVRSGVLVTFGTSGFAMGVSSVQFDNTTGQPLAFHTHTSVTAAGAITPIGAWHFPADSCVVVAGVRNSSTAANVRVYGQRIFYDSVGNLSADPLVTHTPSGLASGTWAAGPGSTSATMYVLGQDSATIICNAEFALSAGTVTSSANPTVNSIFGGSLDRVSLSVALLGRHGGAALLTTAYQNASGIGTATTWVMIHTGTTAATQVSASRMTATGSVAGVDTRSHVTGISGLGSSAYLVSNASITAQAAPTDTFVTSSVQRNPWVSLTPGYLDSHNNENRDYLALGTNQRRRVRMWDPDTGLEVYGWQYGTSAASNFPLTGRLVSRGEFWFNLNGANFDVWGGAYPIPPSGWGPGRVHWDRA